MWVFIVLLIIGSTIIVARVFRNGAQETLEPEPGERRKLAPATLPPHATTPVWSTAAPAAPSPAAKPSPAEPQPALPYPPPVAEQAGGPCPSCGTETVPGAKFCGECGHRLVG
jgi:hypothetical protein